MRALQHLFSPLQIGAMLMKNRIVMAPMGTNLASPDGEVTQNLINYLEARARGGVGLIVTEDATIGPRYHWNTLCLAEDRFVPGWRDLTHTLHAHGAKVMPQIMHPAFNAPSTLNDGAQPVSASPIPSRLLKEIPRELTLDEIHNIIEQFGDAALRAKAGRCDGVQIHCAHMHHLLGGFLTPYYNKRTDEYGGSLEGRLRLPLEILRHVRSRVDPDFAILIRISANEHLPGGITLSESQTIAPLLVDAGADAVHVSAGTSLLPGTGVPPTGSPQALNSPLAAAIKQVVDVPVICVGRITQPWAAENVIARGYADMVAMGRALLADPEWPNKAAAGNWEDIAPCLGETMCMRNLGSQSSITCLINPHVGKERETRLVPVKVAKKILVIGGGPAGMTAANMAARRSHHVTLIERTSKLGGQLQLAAFAPGKQEYAQAVQYLVTQVQKAGVTVKLNQEITYEAITADAPDAVVLATGGLPIIPSNISGIEAEHVVTAWDVLAGRVFPGPRVIIVGGGKVGCETADYLAHPVDDMNPVGNRITILEMEDTIVLDDRTPWRSLLIQRLKGKGVSIITRARVAEILPDSVKYIRDGREDCLSNIDSVVIAVGTASHNPLEDPLRDAGMPTYVIGDAKSPRNALEAIADGAQAGREI